MSIPETVNTGNDFVPSLSYFKGFESMDFEGQTLLPFSVVQCGHKIYGLDSSCIEDLKQKFSGFTESVVSDFSTTQVYNTDRKFFLYREHAVDTLKVDFEDNYLIITSLHFTALCDLSFKEPNKLVICDKELEVRSAAVMNYLATFYANYLLMFKDCFFFHSGCVIIDDNAYVLHGPSTSGKSTSCGFASKKGYPVLNDELVVIKVGKDGCYAYSTPLRGEFNVGTQKGYPVKGFFRLIKSEEEKYAHIPKGRAVAEILASIFYSTYYFKNSEGKIFKLVQQLVNQVPCCHLWFRKDFTFLEILKEFTK